jgi:hypothetical protein
MLNGLAAYYLLEGDFPGRDDVDFVYSFYPGVAQHGFALREIVFQIAFEGIDIASDCGTGVCDGEG